MRNIIVQPAGSQNAPKGFYVYIHSKISDGLPFYVGKGFGPRGWIVSSRSPWWKRTAQAHGVSISIAQDNLDEASSILLEMWMIAKLRHEGHNLCNMTDGGDGLTGGKKKTVYASTGEKFDSLKDACEFLRKNGYPNAVSGHISSAISGRFYTVYDRSWSDRNFPDHPNLVGRKRQIQLTREANRKEVFCSNGMKFSSLQEATVWIEGLLKKKCHHTNISNCAIGKSKTAYGFKWWYT